MLPTRLYNFESVHASLPVGLSHLLLPHLPWCQAASRAARTLKGHLNSSDCSFFTSRHHQFVEADQCNSDFNLSMPICIPFCFSCYLQTSNFVKEKSKHLMRYPKMRLWMLIFVYTFLCKSGIWQNRNAKEKETKYISVILHPSSIIVIYDVMH